jgi:hypothetical protein
MKNLFLSSILFFSVLLQNKAQSNLTDLIPANSIFAGVLKGKTVDTKFNFEKIDGYSFIEPALLRLEKVLEIDLSFFRTIVLNFSKNGIDPTQTSYVFAENYNGTIFLNFIVNIKDYTLFKSAVDKFSGNAESSIVLKNKYLNLTRNDISLSWLKDYVIISLPITKKESLEDYDLYKTRANILLNKYSDYLSNRTIEKKINELEQFNEWENSVRDAGIWVDYNQIIKNSLSKLTEIANNRIKTVLNFVSSFSGEIYLGTDVSFENGKILSETKIYCSEELTRLFESTTKNYANSKFFDYIDPENYGLYTIACLSPEGIYDGYKKLITERFGSGFPIFQDLFGIFEIFLDEKAAFNFVKGDFFIAYNGYKMETVTITSYDYNPETNEYDSYEKNVEKQSKLISMGLTFGKKSDIMKFIRIFNKIGFINKEKKNLYLLNSSSGTNKFYIKLDRKMLILSNDYDRVVLNKKYKAISESNKNDLKKDFYTMHLNIHNLIKIEEANPEVNIAPIKTPLTEIDKNLGNISAHFYRHQKSAKTLNQEVIFEIKNQEKNPLVLMFDFFNNLYLSKQKGM